MYNPHLIRPEESGIGKELHSWAFSRSLFCGGCSRILPKLAFPSIQQIDIAEAPSEDLRGLILPTLRSEGARLLTEEANMVTIRLDVGSTSIYKLFPPANCANVKIAQGAFLMTLATKLLREYEESCPFWCRPNMM
jgi:hypothetical protein